jgi:hypothetical protein
MREVDTVAPKTTVEAALFLALLAGRFSLIGDLVEG